MGDKSKELEILSGLTTETKDQFIKELAVVIEGWLEKGNLEKLSFYLYRIDVHEYKAGNVINSMKPNQEKSIELATMMVERHLLKSYKKLD